MSAELPVGADTGVATLYREHHTWLRAWLRSKLGDSGQAADLAQDTFMRLLLSASSTGRVPALAEPRAYLRTVANRLVVDHWRRLEIERAYLDVLKHRPESHWPSPESRLIILESLEQIAQMLGRLKPAVREAFLLAQFEGCSCPEIARRLGKSVATVERYLTQALHHCYRLCYGD